MNGKSSRDKGKRGEREIIPHLQQVLADVYRAKGYGDDEVPEVSRNLDQTRNGGVDIQCRELSWLAIEVKMHAKLQIEQWWRQTLSQAAHDFGQLPVLIYRQSSRQAWSKWRVRTLGAVHGDYMPNGPCITIDISIEDFFMSLRAELMARVPVTEHE